jgi:hypothetical protein
VRDGVVSYADEDHLSARFAASIAPALEQKLIAIGIAPTASGGE